VTGDRIKNARNRDATIADVEKRVRATDAKSMSNARLTYKQRLADEAVHYGEMLEGLSPGHPDRALAAAIDEAGAHLSAGERGLVFRQEGWIRALAGTPAEQQALLGRLLKNRHLRTEDGASDFRQALREEIFQRMESISDPVERTDFLRHCLLNEVVADSGAKGSLFHDYMERSLARGVPAAEFAEPAALGATPGLSQVDVAQRQRGLPDGRSADGVARVDAPITHGPQEPGSYLLDYKAGKGAFRADQAERYLDDLVRGGGKIDNDAPDPHRGLIYVSDTQKNALHAREQVKAMIKRRQALDPKDPAHLPSRDMARFYFAYVDRQGVVKFLPLE
jgi:hypothetical protein